jgi:hypothetical protein
VKEKKHGVYMSINEKDESMLDIYTYKYNEDNKESVVLYSVVHVEILEDFDNFCYEDLENLGEIRIEGLI